ncbi:MAG TPA: hypothetical protein VGM98_07175 [Schlesneria sp.]
MPTWMAARRSRIATGGIESTEPEPDVEFEAVPDSESSVLEPESFIATDTEIGLPAFAPVTTTVKKKAQKPKPVPIVKALGANDTTKEDNSIRGMWLRFYYSALMKGILVSITVHSVALVVLGMLVIGGAVMRPNLDVFGEIGEAGESAPGLDIDTTLPFGEPPPEGTAVDFSDASSLLAAMPAAEFDPNSTVRGVSGGTGNGTGGGADGDGNGTIMGPIGIPKYAVTKGSYSVWTDPKDPEPGISYQIVIQFKLPRTVDTYRGSDLTGMVTGTDGYKQVIKFSRTESFPVHDGSVQVRIRVPGADRLVRDIIRIESKLLREKQVIEIEF